MKLEKICLIAILLVFFVVTFAFSAQYRFEPRVSARETYTDNVFRTENNTESDYITTVGVGGTLDILGQTSGMRLNADPRFVTYKDNSRNDTWRLPVTVDIWNNFSQRTRFEIFNRFLRADDPEENRPVIRDEDGEIREPGDSTVRRGRSVYDTNYATARVDHKFGKDDSVYARFLHSLRRDNQDDANDNDRFSPSAGLTYWFGPKWGTAINAVYTDARFDNSSDYRDIASRFQLNRRFTRHFQIFGRYGYANRDNEENDVNDYQVHAGSAGFNYALAKDSRISLGGGYFYQDVDGGNDQEGGFLNGDIFKVWSRERWNARVRGLAGIDRNDFGSERLGFERYGGFISNGTYRFTRHFFGRANARYRYSDFINANREDHRFAVGAGIGWQPLTWMTLSLNYSFFKLDSNETEDYDENRAWFNVTLKPDQPWRLFR